MNLTPTLPKTHTHKAFSTLHRLWISLRTITGCWEANSLALFQTQLTHLEMEISVTLKASRCSTSKLPSREQQHREDPFDCVCGGKVEAGLWGLEESRQFHQDPGRKQMTCATEEPGKSWTDGLCCRTVLRE